jgi:2-oxoisovalerate dehydrogenase E1 component
VPFNYEPVIESVKKTGRIVITGDATGRGSFLNDFAGNIAHLAFDYLDAPPVVVGSRNWITPAHELENSFFPQPHWLIDAIHQKIVPLKGHTPKEKFDEQTMIERNKKGV